jgi:hypothetical protein
MFPTPLQAGLGLQQLDVAFEEPQDGRIFGGNIRPQSFGGFHQFHSHPSQFGRFHLDRGSGFLLDDHCPNVADDLAQLGTRLLRDPVSALSWLWGRRRSLRARFT